MIGTDICFLSATELAEAIRRREVSPVEVVDAHLRRIDKLNGELIAYVHVCAEQAIAAAKAAELEIAAGCYRGPLHGIPIAHKDIYDVRGLPTTAGSRLMAGYVANEDSTVVARLRQAGAICLGKLNTFEFASGSLEVFGETRNPWNTNATVGGSSSGSGAALAARLTPLATGTDTGGSIRAPASYCGIVGLKPTYGRVSRAGIVPLSWSLDQAGPMARNVADTALLLQGMAGPDVRDPSAAHRPIPDYRAALRADLRGVRVGVPISFFFDDADPEVVANVRAATALMSDLGAQVAEIDLPHARFGHAASWAIAYSESFAFHRVNFYARPRDYTAAFLQKITTAACLTAEERVTAERLRQVITAEFLAALRDIDVIVVPTTGRPAYPLDAPNRFRDAGHFTRPVSLAGLPALAVPCGFTSAGLPTSIQIVGRAWEECNVLRVGHAYEQAAGWFRQLPQMRSSPVPMPSAPQAPPESAGTVDAAWVLEFSRLTGLTFVTEADARPIAATVSPIKARLAAGRETLPPDLELAVRPAP